MPEKIDTKRPLSVGEVARRSGVAVSTIHFYESKGLIAGWRNTGNQRRYTRDTLRRVAIIKVAQRAGISLSEIADALADVPLDRVATARDWKALSTQWTAMLEDRIVRLTQLRDQMDSCIGCGCLSLTDCPLRNPADRLDTAGSGAVLLDFELPSSRRSNHTRRLTTHGQIAPHSTQDAASGVRRRRLSLAKPRDRGVECDVPQGEAGSLYAPSPAREHAGGRGRPVLSRAESHSHEFSLKIAIELAAAPQHGDCQQ